MTTNEEMTMSDVLEDIGVSKNAEDYGAKSIKVLKGLEAVKKRPGMYIGDTGIRGLHHCLWEIIDNSVDESVAGFCSKIKVVLHKGNSATVLDNGRGIPVDIHPEEGISAATLAVTVLHAGGKFGGEGSAYSRSGGLHGVGASVVNALSTKFEMRIWRQGKLWVQDFHDGGKPVDKLKPVEDVPTTKTGTEVSFWPDPNVFCDIEDDGDGTEVRKVIYQFDRSRVSERIELLSYLNPGLELTLVDERDDEVFEKTWNAQSFLGFLDFIAAGKNLGDEVLPGLWFEKNVAPTKGSDKQSVYVRVALRPHNGSKNEILSFVNNIYTPGGGTHMTGFKTALLRAINQYGTESKILKAPLTGDDVAEGLAAAILVRVDEPKFEGQTKDKLGSREAQGAVNASLYQFLTKYFEENPREAKEWVQRCVRASKAREAADRARSQVNDEDRVSTGFRLPGKLADCQLRDPAQTEIYFVEGDSAGGSAKQGRERKFQAILPLKGKILNTHRAEEIDVLKNEEVQNIIMALGCGIGKNFDITKLRYHKIVIMTDADVDGAHICTLILTLFHNYMPQLIEHGYVYVAMPPLYRLTSTKNKKSIYIANDEELESFFEKNDRKNWGLQRFKGLGEMNPEQLWETTMDPETRQIGQVEYIAQGAEEQEVFEVLMGEDVPPRRAFIEQNANLAELQV